MLMVGTKGLDRYGLPRKDGPGAAHGPGPGRARAELSLGRLCRAGKRVGCAKDSVVFTGVPSRRVGDTGPFT